MEDGSAVVSGRAGKPVAARPAARVRRLRRRTWYISPEGFRELRHGCLLSNRKAAAAYLGVCVRTIRHWDTGRCRVPWSAVRLLRLLRAGELGGLLDGWEGWTISRDRLVSPDGRAYLERDMRHMWLTVTQAALFREGYDAATRPSGGCALPAALKVGDGGSGTTATFPAAVLDVPAAASRKAAGVLSGHASRFAMPTAFASDAGRAEGAAGAGKAGGLSSVAVPLGNATAARSAAGLVSSSQQVERHPVESLSRLASQGVRDVR